MFELMFLISCDIVKSVRWSFFYYAGGIRHLGMNLNPTDGHAMGFTNGWESNSDPSKHLLVLKIFWRKTKYLLGISVY